jgi:cell filamentation protein
MTPFPNDPYCYPGTDVLINLENIRNQKTLNGLEAQIASLSIAGLALNPITGPFDVPRLQETHRSIFGNVYPWAGELRRGIGMMAKTRPSGFVVTYGPSENVPDALAGVFKALIAENNLVGLDTAQMALRLAWYYSDLDAIHPFRDGNSRMRRASPHRSRTGILRRTRHGEP